MPSPTKPLDPLSTPIVEVEDIIEEYLSFRGYTSSLSAFVQDRTDIATHPPPLTAYDLVATDATSRAVDGNIADFASAFDDANHVDLFILWQNHIPRDLLRLNSTNPNAPEAMELEFYLNLHCATYPFRDEAMITCHSLEEVTEQCGKAMSIFRRYIESRGKGLSHEPEFIAFYALPYVPSPTEHPTFLPLFRPSWLKSLRTKLLQFVQRNIASVVSPPPRIFAAVASYNTPPGLSAMESGEAVRTKKITAFAQSIYNVSLELYRQLGKPGKEMGDQLKSFQDTLDHLAEASAATGANGAVASSRQLSPRAQEKTMGSPRPHKEITSGMNSLAQLDLSLVKADLAKLGASGDDRDRMHCALLLQALRWRLSRAPSSAILSNTLTSYIRTDVLGVLHSEASHRKPLFAVLLGHEDRTVSEYAARLVNTITTMSKGRAYLMEANAECIIVLCDALKKEKKDSIMRKMVLGALQKCSLRKPAQVQMINMGLMKWVSVVLTAHVDRQVGLEDFSLEYVTALLMNLSLRTAGKVEAGSVEPDLLKCLVKLMECENTQVRHYVNGTIYSLLSRVAIREKAREMRLDEVLSKIMGRASGEFQRQAKFILDLIISSGGEAESDDEDEDEEDEEEDDGEGGKGNLMPDEIAEDEGLVGFVSEEGVLSGEGLLCGQYLIREIASAQAEFCRDRDREAKGLGLGAAGVGEFEGDGFGTRAVTPSQARRKSKGAVGFGAGEAGAGEGASEREAREELKKLELQRAEKKKGVGKRGIGGVGGESMGEEDREGFAENNRISRTPTKDVEESGGGEEFGEDSYGGEEGEEEELGFESDAGSDAGSDDDN